VTPMLAGAQLHVPPSDTISEADGNDRRVIEVGEETVLAKNVAEGC